MNFLKSLFSSSSKAVVDQTFSGDAKPYAIDKKAKDCSWEEIQESKKAYWDDHASIDYVDLEGNQRTYTVIEGYCLDSAMDFKSTPRDLFVDGMTAKTRDELPEVDGMRVTVLPITKTSTALDSKEPIVNSSVVICAETLEELQAIPGIRLYKSKTKKKETGKCYFKGASDFSYQRGCAAGAFLLNANHLTRVLVLGDELAAAFEAACLSSDEAAQQWVKRELAFAV